MPVHFTTDGINTVGLQIVGDLGSALTIVAQPSHVLLILLKHELEGLGSCIHIERARIAVTQHGGRQVITSNNHKTLIVSTVEHIVVGCALVAIANMVERHAGRDTHQLLTGNFLHGNRLGLLNGHGIGLNALHRQSTHSE